MLTQILKLVNLFTNCRVAQLRLLKYLQDCAARTGPFQVQSITKM